MTSGGLSWNESLAKRLFEKNLQVPRKGERPVLPQVVRKEYKFSLMQSDDDAQLKKENGLSIAYGISLNFAWEVWNVSTQIRDIA